MGHRERFALIVIVLLLASACASSVTSTNGTTSVPGTTTTTSTSLPVVIVQPEDCDPLPPERVAPEDVAVIGSFTEEEQELVDWALARFSEAGLGLPPAIEIAFDPTRGYCRGDTGRCVMPNGMPRAFICRRVESLPDPRIEKTLLHELAHIWHWTHGTGDEWPDSSAIVGGAPNDDTAVWQDRSEERVAMVVAWGLQDDTSRQIPLLPHDCEEIHRQFVELTGVEPLGSLPEGCDQPSSG